MAEVTSAVIATSLVLISVFVPVSLFPGTTGILYKQFSLTIAFSIAISAFNALTLSPALAAVFLRPETRPTGLLGGASRTRWKLLIQQDHRLVRRRGDLGGEVALRVPACSLSRASARRCTCTTTCRRRLFPAEDQGYFMILVQTPPGASLSYTTDFADRGAAIVQQDPDVYGTFSVMGFSLSGGSSPNSGLIFAPLKPVDERTKKGPGHTAHDIVVRHRAEAVRGSRRDTVCRGASRDRGDRQRRRLPVHAAGRRAQYLRRHRPRGAYAGWRGARSGLGAA